jgi:hypothetical protein
MPKQPQIVEYQKELRYPDRSDEYRVCILWWRDFMPVIINVNPTDVRGYRTIATAGFPFDVRVTTFMPGASPSIEHHAAICAVLGLIKAMWDSQGLIAQISVPAIRSTHLICGHVMVHGKLGSEVVPGVPLLGEEEEEEVIPGAECSMDEGKVGHSHGSQHKLVNYLQALISSAEWEVKAREQFQLTQKRK